MLRKIISLFIIVSILMPMVAFGDTVSEHPGLKLMNYYYGKIKNARTVNPYIINIIAIYEISQDRHIEDIKDYIEWYFSRLNYPDKEGLTGSIYDFEIGKNGEEISTNNYDSADGYAGTFLLLLNLYHLKTGNKALIDNNWKKIKEIAYLIPYLQTPDALTKALPYGNDNVRYLMDNCEAYAGMKAFNELSSRAGYGQDVFCMKVEKEIRNAIVEILYDKHSRNFYWAIDDKVKHKSSWSTFYPDALAQLFPICFDVLSIKSKQRISLWREFNKRYGSKVETFPLEQRMIYEMTKKKMIK